MSAIPKSIETAWKKEMEKVVRSLSEKYNFDFEEAMDSLGAAKKTTTPAKKQPAAKRAVPAYPIPFVETVQEDWCKAVKNNHGLMTQCTMPAVSGDWCKTCAKQAEANESKEPTLGSIMSRVGKEDWVAPNGKAPVPYHKVIAKLNLAESKDQIIEEAAKFGVTLTEEMFVAPQVEKAEAKRGRPRKDKPTVSAAEGDDLISNLVAQAQANMPASPAVEDEQPNVQYLGTAVEKEETKKTKKAAKKPKMTEEEKAAAKLQKEQEKAAAKLQKEQERAAAKLKKEEEKAAAKLQKEQERAAAKTKKAQQDQEKADAKEANAQQEAAEVEEEEYDDEAVKVEKFVHKGKEYLRSADDVLYDAETHSPVGQWNESEGKIEGLNDKEF